MSDPVTRLNAALEGRYAIERELGEGGMATVYLADDLKHERKVALKVLKPELAAVVGAERFLAEIKTTANLQHPHILPLHDSGEADGFLFYVMPFVEGETLRDRLDREHQLPVDEAVKITTDLAEALGSELFYRTEDQLMVVAVEPGDTFRGDTPRPLFTDPYVRDGANTSVPMYDIMPDGQRFVMVSANVEGTGEGLAVILVENWFEELRQRTGN